MKNATIIIGNHNHQNGPNKGVQSIGTFLRIFIDWKKGKKFSEEVGIPLAAGFIVGEALIGVGYAFASIVAAGS